MRKEIQLLLVPKLNFTYVCIWPLECVISLIERLITPTYVGRIKYNKCEMCHVYNRIIFSSTYVDFIQNFCLICTIAPFLLVRTWIYVDFIQNFLSHLCNRFVSASTYVDFVQNFCLMCTIASFLLVCGFHPKFLSHVYNSIVSASTWISIDMSHVYNSFFSLVRCYLFFWLRGALPTQLAIFMADLLHGGHATSLAALV